MTSTRVRWRPLLALTAAVLAAHLWLLRGALEVHLAPQRLAQPSLATRTIVPAPPLVAAAEPSRAAALPAPPVRPAVRTTPAVVRSQHAAGAAPSAMPEETAPAPTLAPVVAPEPARVAVPVAAAAPIAFAIPGSVRLHYKVTALSRQQLWQARGQLDWHHDGSSYEAKLEVSAPLLPTRTQRSTGNITAEGLAPLRFSDKARSEEAAHFERDKGKVSFSSNRPDAALMAGAQDRLSVMLQLAALIAGEPKKYPATATIEIQTAGTRDAEPWHFTVEGEEQLQLPGGAVKALRLTRNPRKEFDQKVELWLGPAMDYVPVRLRLTQPNGDWVDQQWSSTDKG
jgi:hypothetical protein